MFRDEVDDGSRAKDVKGPPEDAKSILLRRILENQSVKAVLENPSSLGKRGDGTLYSREDVGDRLNNLVMDRHYGINVVPKGGDGAPFRKAVREALIEASQEVIQANVSLLSNQNYQVGEARMDLERIGWGGKNLNVSRDALLVDELGGLSTVESHSGVDGLKVDSGNKHHHQAVHIDYASPSSNAGWNTGKVVHRMLFTNLNPSREEKIIKRGGQIQHIIVQETLRRLNEMEAERLKIPSEKVPNPAVRVLSREGIVVNMG